jgi:amino acid transporter
MSVLGFLLGRPLASRQESTQQVGVFDGVAVFGLDALGSAAYGPEAVLTVLIPAGVLGLRYILPLSGIVTALLPIVYLSYRQTISAYPNGGGAYTVAGHNLGPRVGMFAGAALMLDYLLNVTVGISTGVGALVSALPRLQPHTVALCLSVLAIMVLANLRGLHEAGTLWIIPTYTFVLCLGAVVLAGVTKAWGAWGRRQKMKARTARSRWLLRRSWPPTGTTTSCITIARCFSSCGCFLAEITVL